MRIALFGGTFDPPHRGHLAIARAAADTFALDRVLFAPTGLQPLKLAADPTPFATRLALVEAACAPGYPHSDHRFAASEIDAPRPGHSPNYTVDTLAALAAQYPPAESGTTLFNLVGADAFLTLPRWHRPGRLLALAEWIVVTRPGYPLTESALVPLALTPAQRARVHILDGIAEDVSATALRSRLHAGDPCLDLLPAPVAAYIAEHGLYR
jgi:nicotinate-nucleotide adenylyltransferase